jgi:hypothetical protein
MDDGFGHDRGAFSGSKDDQLDASISSRLSQHTSLLAGHPDSGGPDGLGFLPSEVPDANPEKRRIASRLSGFNPKETPVWQEITRRFGPNVKQPELVSIASVLAQSANIRLDRDAKRRKSVLIKWFQENWDNVPPFLDYVFLGPNARQT